MNYIQDYKHTLLFTLGPICMGANSAAGLGGLVPVNPFSVPHYRNTELPAPLPEQLTTA